MGISVALTPATTVVTMSKSMITNASFRTKKLPGESANIIYARFTTFFPTFLCCFVYCLRPCLKGTQREGNDRITRLEKIVKKFTGKTKILMDQKFFFFWNSFSMKLIDVLCESSPDFVLVWGGNVTQKTAGSNLKL
jgi:hypothetical protein